MNTVKIFAHEEHPDVLGPDHRIRLVYDENYQTRGSYEYDTPEETKEAEDFEIDKLERFEWIVLGRIPEVRCAHCGTWMVDEINESLWGIVVANSNDGYYEAAFEV